jgi:hypothetical protein
MNTPTHLHRGGCHCGRVRFEADGPAHLDVLDCNCSICSKAGFLHWIVPKSRFRLLTSEDALSTYTFGTAVARHHFCSTCGIKPFYVPRSNPDGFDINVRCLDDDPARRITIERFDGRNWEDSGGALAHLSAEP